VQSLTGWCGFYLADSKENLWPNRRLVVQDKKTGEYFEDFSGYDNHRGAVRDMLGLHPYEIVEVNPSQHPDHLIFLESASRNRMLKANTRFLYQVFPGTSAQCRRQLLRAARIGELDTVKKLLLFFKRDKEFVNGRDTETGNTALHIASRQGHLAVMMTLLESEADVDPVNNAGSTPFFLATEGLHKTASLLLLEWGADIHVKNRLSKTALDLTRNSDLKVFLSRKYLEYQELQEAVRKSDCRALEGHIDKHLDNTDPMASLNSRCVGGGSLLHAAASTGSLDAVKKLLGQEVRPDIRDEVGATPLHITRDPAILQEMLAYDGDVNSVDSRGNSPLHCLCSESRDIPSLPDCVSLLVGRGASLNLKNHASKLPIHCAAAFGLTPVIDSLVTCGATVGFSQDDLHQLLDESTLSSLPYLAITGNHLRCSQWLVGKDFLFRAEELDELLVKLLLPGPNTLVSELKEALRFVVEQGADVNILCKKGNRPLHLAAALTDHPDLVEVLLEAGADPNIPNSSSATPLIIACQSNNLFSASILLQRGASFSIKNAVGKCAFEYISDFEEWIQSGLFSPGIVSQLRGFKLRQGKELVSSLSKLLNSSTHLQTYF
jgi:ankyrin repeat protein